MDQLTHTVRRSNWINIIQQCQDLTFTYFLVICFDKTNYTMIKTK